jgi:predicted amidohydrolase YtcJ
VSSEALARAHITPKTPDPPRGRIDRDAAGRPTGTLQEDAATLVYRLVPLPSLEERRKALDRALKVLGQDGITAVQMPLDKDVPPGFALDVLKDAETRGALSTKFVVALAAQPSQGLEQVDELVRVRQAFTSARVRPTAVKIFEDGIIETHTAALLAPYTDQPGQSGEPIWPKEKLDPFVKRLAEHGFNVHVHAIGDRAVRLVLDAVEGTGPAPGHLRHQIAHVQMVDPADVSRFRALGVIANFQPLWAYPDNDIRDLTVPLIGPDRMKELYVIGSLLRSGAQVAFGSDWDVSSPNPLEGIQVAVTRQALDKPGEALLPEEAISLPEALAAYTIGSAYANGLEAETGSIEVGKAADLVVLSADLFAVPVHEIAHARVMLTLVDGVPVFQDPSFPAP